MTEVTFGRRTLDVLLGSALLVLAIPVLAVSAALILLTDGRPVLFTQDRIGERGRCFRMYKLRTMRVAAGPGAAVTATNDVRITRVGQLLRRTSFDELPQLWQVVRGQMTLVGPRPESQTLAARYPEDCRFVLDARPGLTGPAQLAFRERSAVPPPGWDVEAWYLTVLVPIRARADREFLDNPTVRACLRHLVRTAMSVTGLVDYQEAVAARSVEPDRRDQDESLSLKDSPAVDRIKG